MKRGKYYFLLVVCLLLPVSLGEAAVIEFSQSQVSYNLQSGRGVPISTNAADYGSDGRMSVVVEGNDLNPPLTANQFRGMVSFGAVPGLRQVDWLSMSNSPALRQGNAPFNADLAVEMNLPVARATSENLSSPVVMVMRQAQVGAPYLSRQVSYAFGSVISVPNTDENGVLLPDGVFPEDYWFPEPYTSNSHEGERYYWSPHARKVYATEAGPMSITWRKRGFYETSSVPADYTNVLGSISYETNGFNVYLLHTVNHVVSGSASQTPRKIYWTEGAFARTGVLVDVPESRVGAVNIIYSGAFPRAVDHEYVGIGDTSISDGSDIPVLEERRTLWYEYGSLHAYNIEGRVLVEFLGDENPDGYTRQSMGIEIVDVYRQPQPTDVEVLLGERLFQPPSNVVGDLKPLSVIGGLGELPFVYEQMPDLGDELEIYATRLTTRLNDLLIHWTETGLEGTRWPRLYGRYHLVWPEDSARYSHYLRPVVASEDEAMLTAVNLDDYQSSTIEYQDPLDQARAHLTVEGDFYTYLDAEHPAHRTLLRYVSQEGEVAFERVLSLLDENVRSLRFADSISSELGFVQDFNSYRQALAEFESAYAAWSTQPDRSDADEPVPPRMPESASIPRIHAGIIEVGERLTPPVGELGSGSDEFYLAGHIHGSGDSGNDLYNINAYVDPLLFGFEEANKGAIIPVNAIPGRNSLQVWWFRASDARVGAHAGDTSLGFVSALWPSVIGEYLVVWPSTPGEIILASNQGSGPLPANQSAGSLYVQNDAGLPGYNPNEEHALMAGGAVYALRDDLNDRSVANYSSEPFVLLEFTASDGRPDMRPFRVLRETESQRFVYDVQAGERLQAPMPLPLLDPPLGPTLQGLSPLQLGGEVYYRTVDSSDNNASEIHLTTRLPHHFRPWFREIALQSPDLRTNLWIMVTNAVYEGQSLSGRLVDLSSWSIHSPQAAQQSTVVEKLSQTSEDLTVGLVTSVLDWFAGTHSFPTHRWRTTSRVSFSVESRYSIGAGYDGSLVPGQRVWLVNASAHEYIFATVQAVEPAAATLVLSWQMSKTIETITYGDSDPPDSIGVDHPQAQSALALMDKELQVLLESSRVYLPLSQVFPKNHFAGWQLRTEPVPASTSNPPDASFTLRDRKGDIWVYRGPHTAEETPYFGVQYYYGTQPGFFFPGLPLEEQPPLGTVTPYLRSGDSLLGYAGDGVYGDSDYNGSDDGNSLEVIYRPVWPDSTPVLQMAETLTNPKRGLPAVRGQSSLEVVYQQSTVVSGPDQSSVVLHDPTRYKKFALGDSAVGSRLGGIPASVKTSNYRGKTYFPDLPPHLSERFFLDPNDGGYGSLVLGGAFVEELVGDSYLLLNSLTPYDSDLLTSLCLQSDPDYSNWARAIGELSTLTQTFVENPEAPGTYVPNTATIRGPADLSEVTSSDVAVDSYALTATGPGTGYVTILAGNGKAFTPAEEPVSLHVIRIEPALYTGQVKPILSSNPLAEKVTLQQVVDLAGRTGDYEFEWRIAPPVNGSPAPVYLTDAVTLQPSGGDWFHLEFPLPFDHADSMAMVSQSRFATVSSSFIPVSVINFNKAVWLDGSLIFTLTSPTSLLQPGNRVRVQGYLAGDLTQTWDAFGSIGTISSSTIEVTLDAEVGADASWVPSLLQEASGSDLNPTASILYRRFNILPGNYTQLWLSLDASQNLGVEVFLDGEPLVAVNRASGNTPKKDAPSYLNPLSQVFEIDPAVLDRHPGIEHSISVATFSSVPAGVPQIFDLKLEALESVDVTDQGSNWLPMDSQRFPDGLRTIIGEAADVRALSDNYLIMRYRASNPAHASFVEDGGWSRWTTPALAEGWIKRVLAGINPFNQRVSDLFNNAVNTDVSMLTQAGRRYEGDVALNLDEINNYGLIEIYETVLKRGRMLSIDYGINYGPANDAMLLAAGYLNDLYMFLGNEAVADAANPTIGIGTANESYGDMATASFSFEGQVPSLLEEELALLRGRDDFLQPGVELAPFYNRLVWNYTRGIDSGEAIYAINYDVRENPNQSPDGVIDAEDAAYMFPQGHGDAYGHYLTAVKGYYSLLTNPSFDWVPRIEAVNVLGAPVAVNYQDERKFAAAAAALARTGQQVFDLTWRRDYAPIHGQGWEHMSSSRTNNTTRQLPTERHWGTDAWASRSVQGAYINWALGNSLLPALDEDPTHEGIQKVDRTTVPELAEITAAAADIQQSLENAENGLSPLGVPEDGLVFDINPAQLAGVDGGSHFEQVYDRAVGALNNAVAAFDDAKNVTRMMRVEGGSLNDLQLQVAREELAYKNKLIELYGTPYADDMRPGATYVQDYDGPDLLHFFYTEIPQMEALGLLEMNEPREFKIDKQGFYSGYEKGDWDNNGYNKKKAYFDFVQKATYLNKEDYQKDVHYVSFTLDSAGNLIKPANFTGQRSSPGQLQQAIAKIQLARNAALGSLSGHEALKRKLDRSIEFLEAVQAQGKFELSYAETKYGVYTAVKSLLLLTKSYKIWSKRLDNTAETFGTISTELLPRSTVLGLANGGDLMSAPRASIIASTYAAQAPIKWYGALFEIGNNLAAFYKEAGVDLYETVVVKPLLKNVDYQGRVVELDALFTELQESLWSIDQRLQELSKAEAEYRALLAQGERLQAEREVFRKRSAALVQGYRTRDAAFRIFRNEKLERYKTLFELAARYSLLAANAYDYETGLLGTESGRAFVRRIMSARALGIVADGVPQYYGSNTGDAGLSSALAEMRADWEVVRTRLGINNPDAYGTTVSLRTELFRIHPDQRGKVNWGQILETAKTPNLMDDPDVVRHCLQLANSDGGPVPGLMLEFSTSIQDGYNLFGKRLAAGDHAFSSSSFATKVFALGVALDGYQGMDIPDTNGGAIEGSGGSSPSDPDTSFLDSQRLAATPYVYLIPVGVDTMRSPPLGDTSTIRSWRVSDLAVPMPFNLGASDFSTAQLYQSGDSLTEPLFAVRKHQAFRPVPDTSYFDDALYTGIGTLQRSQYTNNRMVGRSVWNSHWKLVIPGKTLLADPEEGLKRFIQTVSDIKLHFVTYSYSGN